MPTRSINLRVPVKGVVRKSALQSFPRDALYDARDFVPTDYKTGRQRLAVRPGWSSYGSPTQTGVNLIATLNVAPSETHKRILVTATAGELYKWDHATSAPTQIGGADIIATGVNVQAAPYLGELFIATTTPQVYTYAPEAVAAWSASIVDGSLPSGFTLICEWANRIVVAAGHVWYMSRINNPRRWLFASDDAASPVAATDVEGGQIGATLTALIPHNRECILFGTANTLTILRDNPADGGTLERLSHVIGITNGTAWCKTADDWTYFLSRDGLYRMPPGCGVPPQQVSRSIIPESLLNIDGITTTAYLAYDVRFRGIHIYVTGVVDDYWWFDLEHESFWPFTVPGSSILAIGRHDPIETADKSGVLVGTSSGLRRLDRTASLGGASPAYFKMLYPLETSLGVSSRLIQAYMRFGDNSTDTGATIDFYGDESAEDVVAAPTSRRKRVTLDTLINNHWNCYPQLDGTSGMIHVAQADTTKHLTFEKATLFAEHLGRGR